MNDDFTNGPRTKRDASRACEEESKDLEAAMKIEASRLTAGISKQSYPSKGDSAIGKNGNFGTPTSVTKRKIDDVHAFHFYVRYFYAVLYYIRQRGEDCGVPLRRLVWLGFLHFEGIDTKVVVL